MCSHLKGASQDIDAVVFDNGSSSKLFTSFSLGRRADRDATTAAYTAATASTRHALVSDADPGKCTARQILECIQGNPHSIAVGRSSELRRNVS